MKIFALSLTCTLSLTTACLDTPALDAVERHDERAEAVEAVDGLLRVDPAKPTGFVNDAGPVWLTGIIVAGGPHGYNTYGWPFAHNDIISQAAANGANFVHMRAGPFRVGSCSPFPHDRNAYRRLPDGRYDLDTWNDEFWTQLRARVRHADAQRMYVEIDLVDAWALKDTNLCDESGRVNMSPWYPTNNLQNESIACNAVLGAPPQRVKDFVRKVADVVGDLDNVIFEVGNETGACAILQGGVSLAWEEGIITTMRDRLAQRGFPDHLIGTNSEKAVIEGSPHVDYIERHPDGLAAIVAGKPTMVNEYSENTYADKFMRDTWESFTRGTMRHYWFGENDTPAQVAATFARLATFRQFVDSVPHGLYRVLSQGVVGIPDQEWVAFTRTGVMPPMSLGPVERSYRLDWIDPRTAAIALTTTFVGSGTQTFPPPTATEWALRVRAGAPIDGPWLEDRFDDLALGSLHGQHGWLLHPHEASAPNVVAGLGGDRELAVDSPPLAITINKDVPLQTAGRHRIEVAIRATTGVVNASVAKLEIKNGSGATWDKLFQIFAGASIRVNYAQSGASVTAVASVVPNTTYLLRCDVDLATGQLQVSVDGGPIQTVTIGQADRRIGRLAILGWDVPGAIIVDDLIGRRLDTTAPPTITVTSPTPNQTVTGVVTVRADASASTQRVELYADGWLVAADTTAPYEIAWDTRVNHLPAPNHAIDYGYHFVEWKHPSTFAARRAETNSYTNSYFASLSTYITDTPSQWIPLLTQSLATAAAEGRHIHLHLELQDASYAPLLGAVLDAARPYWSSVARIELANEPSWTPEHTTAIVLQVDTALTLRGLARPPGGYGITYVYTEALPTAAAVPGLTWIGLEAYLDPPGSPIGIVNFRALVTSLSAAMQEVPAGKQIMFVPMSYDRNGAWTNVETLLDLQTIPYLFAHNDPRVIALQMFAYTRPGGAFDHPGLRTTHKLIGEKILGRAIRGAGNGPRVLYAKAIDAAGANAVGRVVVTVANPP